MKEVHDYNYDTFTQRPARSAESQRSARSAVTKSAVTKLTLALAALAHCLIASATIY